MRADFGAMSYDTLLFMVDDFLGLAVDPQWIDGLVRFSEQEQMRSSFATSIITFFFLKMVYPHLGVVFVRATMRTLNGCLNLPLTPQVYHENRILSTDSRTRYGVNLCVNRRSITKVIDFLKFLVETANRVQQCLFY